MYPTVIESDLNARRRKRRKRKRLSGTVRRRPSKKVDEAQKVVHSPIVPTRNIKLLNSVTLPQLSDFDLTPLTPVPFADIHSFLGHNPSIEILHLYGVEVPEGVWPPPSLTIPILPHITSITAHPFYVVFILKGLLLDKKASLNLTNIAIAISSEPSYVTTAPFNYALFDDALECVAGFLTKIDLTLRFGGTNDSDVYNWFEEHLAMTNGASKSSVISRLDNVTSLHAFSCYFDYSWKTIEVLPDWLGLFPNLTSIDFGALTARNLRNLKKKEFVRKVAKACQKVEWLYIHGEILHLEQVDTNLNAKGGQGC